MNLINDKSKKRYPAINFLLQFSTYISILSFMIIPLTSIWLWSSGSSFINVSFGLFLSTIQFVFVKSYLELIHVLADMLLPK
jgi:hypothetical protein